MSFQTQVNLQQAPAVEGDFASANPRAVVLTPEAGFVAGASGVTVGHFAWIDADGRRINSTGTGAPAGFVHREQQGLITTYLAESGMTVQTGFPVILHSQGDFWVKNTGSASVVGGTVYANLTTGAIETASGAGNVATGFKFASVAATNELAKITSWG